jgi:hypothetical protein
VGYLPLMLSTCGKKNYKIPEWLNPDEVTLDMAKLLIAYKQNISEEWFEKKKMKAKMKVKKKVLNSNNNR